MTTVAPRRRRWRLVVLGLVVVVIGLGVWTAISGLVAAHRLRAVRADIEQLTQQTALDRATLQRRLTADAATARSAGSLLGQVGPRIVGWLPVVGRNVDAERAVADASTVALQAGAVLARQTDGLDNGQGGVDVDRLRSAATALADASTRLRAPLRRLADQPVGWTLPPVGDGVRQARDRLLGLDTRLARGAAGLDALVGVLGGDGRRTVLVGLMNNAELRGAGGLLSAYAIGHTDAGRLALGHFRDVNTVAQPPHDARRVPSPPEFHRDYGPFLADTTLWKNVTMSPQASQSAQVLAAVAATSLRVRPDVVVLCDVPAAADLISATGPVTIQGQQVTGDELTKRLLVDAYGDGSLSRKKQIARRLALTSAATQAFDRLRHDATATPALLQALLDAVSGRHLVVWSDRTDEERRLEMAQLGGNVDATGKDVALVATNNLGDSPQHGNKLDYYVDRDLSVDVRLRPDEATVTQTLKLHNGAPPGLGPYVQGVAHPGEIRELLSLDAAAGATLTGFTRDGAAADVDVTRVDGAQRVTTVVQLPRGATTTYRLSYRLPVHDDYRLLLVPQPLAKPAHLTLRISAASGALGVARGVDQPRDGVIRLAGPWDAMRDITVPVHPLSGLRGVLHTIAHFWTHKVGA